MKDYIETQYKNLDFTIPDDYVSRREVYAMLDYIGGSDADEAFYQGWDAAIDEACSLLNDVDSAMGWTPVEEELHTANHPKEKVFYTPAKRGLLI